MNNKHRPANAVMLQHSPYLRSVILKMEAGHSSRTSAQTYTQDERRTIFFQKSKGHLIIIDVTVNNVVVTAS